MSARPTFFFFRHFFFSSSPRIRRLNGGVGFLFLAFASQAIDVSLPSPFDSFFFFSYLSRPPAVTRHSQRRHYLNSRQRRSCAWTGRCQSPSFLFLFFFCHLLFVARAADDRKSRRNHRYLHEGALNPTKEGIESTRILHA